MSQWGIVEMGILQRYANLDGKVDDVGDDDDKGYMNERDCCVNGEKQFFKNRWVRNYWVTEKKC